MAFMLFWFFSTVVVFFLLFCVFQLDEKYAWGSTRGLVEDWWILYLIINLIPFLNLLVCLISIIVFVIILIAEQLDDHNLDGEKVLKKIFFIKDGK